MHEEQTEKTLKVYAWDQGSRAFIGSVILDESDLSPVEEGIFLLPGCTMRAAPPEEVPEGKEVFAETNESWGLRDLAPPPAPPRIVAVSNAQARVVLIKNGVFTTVNNAILGMEGIEGEIARARWEYAGTIDRESDLVKQMAAVLGWDDAKLDELFQQASKL